MTPNVNVATTSIRSLAVKRKARGKPRGFSLSLLASFLSLQETTQKEAEREKGTDTQRPTKTRKRERDKEIQRQTERERQRAKGGNRDRQRPAWGKGLGN